MNLLTAAGRLVVNRRVVISLSPVFVGVQSNYNQYRLFADDSQFLLGDFVKKLLESQKCHYLTKNAIFDYRLSGKMAILGKNGQ